MTPIIASQAARLAGRAAGRRQFSMVNTLRNFARGLEHTPFERMPQTPSAPADWAKQFRRVGSSTAVFLPFIGGVLGWPLAVSYIMDGHVGQF